MDKTRKEKNGTNTMVARQCGEIKIFFELFRAVPGKKMYNGTGSVFFHLFFFNRVAINHEFGIFRAAPVLRRQHPKKNTRFQKNRNFSAAT